MNKYILLVLVLFLSSCAAKKKAAELELYPEWVKIKPIVPSYYIGIGSAKKVGTVTQYTAEARRDALSNMAEDISSQVSSSSVLHTIENDYGVTESFIQKIEIETDDYLEGFEPVDSYETESLYWIYYRIFKSTYREMKEQKKQEAIANALAKYESGLQQLNENKPKEAISFYLQGLQALKRYLSEETPTDFNGNSIDLGSKLYSSLNDILSNCTIQSEKEEFSVTRGKTIREPIRFQVLFNNTPINDLPIHFSYSGGYLKNNVVNTDINGWVECFPGVIKSKNTSETLTAKINIERIANKAVDDLFIRGIALKKKLNSSKCYINILAPKVYFSISESPCSNNKCSRITETFVERATSRNFDVTDIISDSNYYFELSYKFKPGQRAGNLVQVEIISELKVTNAEHKILFIKKIANIKGVGTTINEAEDKAFQEYLNSLKRRYFEQGFNKLF